MAAILQLLNTKVCSLQLQEPQSVQYRKVAANILKFYEFHRDIQSILKVYNRDFYQRYQLMRRQMHERDPEVQVERVLFHGTSRENMVIIHFGFNRSHSTDWNQYGRGCYFTSWFDVAAGEDHATPDESNVQYVIQTRVLTGVFAEGDEGLIEPHNATASLWSCSIKSTDHQYVYCVYDHINIHSYT